MFWAAFGVMCFDGCSHEADFHRETSSGGVIAFSVQSEADIFSSTGRRDALRMMQDKCPSGVRILKEGELPKVSSAADRAWGAQLGTGRIWGIEFICK